MHLKIGHEHEERHRKESYWSFYPQEVLKFCSSPVRKNNNKNMNKMAQNRKFQFFKKVILSCPFDFIFATGPKLLPN